jgi:ABC-type nickel/cobalt efflux system permease component RcnA
MKNQSMQQPSRDRFVLLAVILSAIAMIVAVVSLTLAILVILGFSIPSIAITTLGNLVTFVLPALLFGIGLSLIVQVIRQRIASFGARAEQRRLEQIKQKISSLTATSPDLAVVLELINETEDIRRAKASGRAFWQGVVQNFIFYILGVMAPLILLRTHIGP